MQYSWVELALIALILAGLVWAGWRGGSANPEPTGRLSRKMTQLSGQVAALEGKVDQLERESASVKDIERLEERIQTVCAEIAGDRELAERTWKSIERIERFLIEKGLGGGR